MAQPLYRYLCHIESAGVDPSLLRSVPPSVLTKVCKEVKKVEAQPKKRGTYSTVTAEAKARVTTYGNVNRARAAVKRSKFI